MFEALSRSFSDRVSNHLGSWESSGRLAMLAGRQGASVAWDEAPAAEKEAWTATQKWGGPCGASRLRLEDVVGRRYVAQSYPLRRCEGTT